MGRFFAPLIIPLKRRLQTGIVALWLATMPMSLLSCFVIIGLVVMMFMFGLVIPGTIAVGLIGVYGVHVVTDDRWKKDGARQVGFMRSRFFQKASSFFNGFFPASVVIDGVKNQKDFESMKKMFPTDKNYLFCCHPHGVFGLGVWNTFVANNKENTFFHNAVFGEKPLFHTTIHTMSVNFRIPWWREVLMYLGFVDVDRKTLIHGLNREVKGRKAPGRICVLMPGGAAESIDCATPTLTLKKRKGFVKIALETGGSLVPVFTFGENKLYKPVANPDGIIRKVLFTLQKTFGIGMPLVCGRGIFNYNFGFLPHRETLTTVIGHPIAVKQMAKGTYTESDVNDIHEKYMKSVKELYAKYQPIYDPDSEYKELMLR